MKFKIIFTIYCFVCVYTFNKGQDVELDSNQIKTIDEVIVTGFLRPIDKRYIPYTVDVISKDALQKSSELNVLNIIEEEIPGIFITQRSNLGFGVASGSAGTINSRGLGGFPTTQVLMLVDGRPQFMGIMGHHLPDAYSILNVEKVEVIKGPASLLYGTNSLGGAINIITHKPSTSGFSSTANIMTGSFGTYSFVNNSMFSTGKLFCNIGSSLTTTDGHRSNSSFSSNSGYFKAGINLNKNLFIYSDVYLTKYNASDPGPDTINANPGIVADIFRGYWSFNVNNYFKNLDGSLSLYHNFGKHVLSDGFKSRDYHAGVKFYENLSILNNNLTI